jgi:hypothetical protein
LLERLIDQLVKRDCTFEVVFFDSESTAQRLLEPVLTPELSANAHGTVHTGSDVAMVAAKALARSILIRQAASLPSVHVKSFASLEDPEWMAYFDKKRPMFMLGFDGGLSTKEDGLDAERVLTARVFLFRTMSQGIRE